MIRSVLMLLVSSALWATSASAATSDCLDLEAYMNNVRAMPNSLFMHHQLANLKLQGASDTQIPSDLATQRALDLFYHPNLVTLGLAAGKNGGSYLHDFSVRQLDCAKVVTGNIFATEGMSIIWEIAAHTSTSLLLKRLSQGGNAEISSDLTLGVRQFQAISPTSFVVTSAYKLVTAHACGPTPASEIDETNQLIVSEIFSIDPSAQDPQDTLSDSFISLMTKYPRLPAPVGRRGDFATPITPANNPVCKTGS